MSDPEKETARTVESSMNGRPPEEFPTPEFPTVFADLVLSSTRTPWNIKMYLCRVDPNMFGHGGNKINPFMQIVMPTAGFLQTAMFLEQTVHEMVKEKILTQEQVDTARSSVRSQQKTEDSDAD